MDIFDNELIYMIRENDKYAKEYLFLKYKPLVEKITFEVYKNCKKLDLNDIRQELILTFISAIESYNENKRCFFSYLYICLHNRSLNIKREYFTIHSATNLSVSLENIVEGFDRRYGLILKDDGFITNPIMIYQINESKVEFKNNLSALSNLEKNVLQLYNLGSNRKEISKILKISLKKVDNALSRAKIKMRGNN